MIRRTKVFLEEFFAYFGDEPMREGLLDTPKRFFKAWDEMLSGYKKDPAEILSARFTSSATGMICCRDIELYSTCEHHVLPFFGRAHIAYVPDGAVVGISKLVRLIECYARRLQIQEELTEQVANAIMEELNPRGCMVIVEAQHLCMKARGVKNHSSVMVTSAIRGVMEDKECRQEALTLLLRGEK